MLDATVIFPRERFRQYLALREEHQDWIEDGRDLASVQAHMSGVEKRGPRATIRWKVDDDRLPYLYQTAKRLAKAHPENDFFPWSMEAIFASAGRVYQYDHDANFAPYRTLKIFARDIPKLQTVLTKAKARTPDDRRSRDRLLWCAASAERTLPRGVDKNSRIPVKLYVTDIIFLQDTLRVAQISDESTALFRLNAKSAAGRTNQLFPSCGGFGIPKTRQWHGPQK